MSPHASLPARVGAGLVDIALTLPVAILLNVAFGTGERIFDGAAAATATSREINEAYWTLFGTGVGVLLFYSAAAEIVTGTSVGKRLLGIHPVEAGGTRIGRGRALMRNLAKWASIYLFFVGLLWALIDRRNRMWHDLIVGAYVADGPVARGPTAE